MIRIYQNMPLETSCTVTLDSFASQHLLKVLRLRVGSPFIIFNGQGGEYHVTLTAIEKKQAVVCVSDFKPINRESKIQFHLGQGLSRGERMDYAIQKSVELGVASITPIFSERCTAKLSKDRIHKRLLHWEKVIISASEQSGRAVLPVIYPPQALSDWVHSCDGLNLMCDFHADSFDKKNAPSRVNLLIGPEGGFTDAEVQKARKAQFESLYLGPRTLRTETAPIAALSKLQTLF